MSLSLESFGHIARLVAIARTLARHDSLFILETLGAPSVLGWLASVFRRKADGSPPGQRLAAALQEMGPSFIKLGQMLSTRSDLLGEELAADLSGLQDKLPPFSGAEARAVIEAEFAKPLSALFSDFNETAIAAASIAQVHFAVTPDGREVAVKVLRPGIEEAFHQDLRLFFWIARLVERTRPEYRRLKPVEVVATLARSVNMEMDLRFEAAAANELAENFAGDETFRVPEVDWMLTARRVLTTQRVHGTSMSNAETLRAAGHDPLKILERSAGAFFLQVFRDGFFHADMHPGNVFVTADGALAVVDFGIMGRLDRKTRRHLAELLMAFLNRDYRRAAEVHFEAGWIPRDQSVDTFTQACRSIAEPILDKPQNEVSVATLLGHLFKVTETFQMETQPQLLLLQKTMLVAEGTGRRIAPEANMWWIARPLIETWMLANLGPEARLKEGVQEAVALARRLPALVSGLERALNDFESHGLKLHPETVAALRRQRGPAPGVGGGSAGWGVWAVAVTALAVATLALVI